MHIMLLKKKRIEVRGRSMLFVKGDWIDVGKQTALRWIREGVAAPVGKKSPIVTLPGQGLEWTIFFLPFPFARRHRWEQNNALGSWRALASPPDLLPLMTERDLEQDQNGGLTPLVIGSDQYGTPLISSTFRSAQEALGPDEIMCYVNADVLMFGLDTAIERVAQKFGDEPWLVVGRRWDIDMPGPLNFGHPGWRTRVEELVMRGGRRRGPDAIDYFAFRNGVYPDIPPFRVGRSAWDNWLVADALARGVNVVDATLVVHPVHQEIPRPVSAQIQSRTRIYQHKENRALYDARVSGFRGITREAPWILGTEGELVVRERGV